MKKQYLCAIKQQLTDRVKTGRVTYGNSVISYANASESLFAMLTPPCKHPYNQIVSRNSTAQSHILALPLGILCPVCDAFFVQILKC